MTVGYMKEVATIGPLTYLRLLARWRGSIWKSIVNEFVLWIALYNIISLIYRIALFGTEYGAAFEVVVTTVDSYLKAYGSTLNFVAAFYISYVNARWWWLFMEIPWPDTLCMLISALMKTNGPAARQKERQIRLAICRYWNLSFVLLMRDISVSAKKRFPSLDNLNPSLATKEEIRLLREAADKIDGEEGGHFQQTCLYALPLTWVQKIIKHAADDGNFLNAHLNSLHEEIVRTRQKMYNLLAQDFLCVLPVALTQVALAAPVIYFTLCLVGKQYIVNLEKTGVNASTDWVIPFYTIYEFVIYVGWIKAAMSMLNPFGTDDDDFEVDYLIDRNNSYSRILLDELFEKAPTPQDVEYQDLPHTFESSRNMRNVHPMVGSAANMSVDKLDPPIVKLPRATTPVLQSLNTTQASFGMPNAAMTSTPIAKKKHRQSVPPVLDISDVTTPIAAPLINSSVTQNALN